MDLTKALSKNGVVSYSTAATTSGASSVWFYSVISQTIGTLSTEGYMIALRRTDYDREAEMLQLTALTELLPIATLKSIALVRVVIQPTELGI